MAWPKKRNAPAQGARGAAGFGERLHRDRTITLRAPTARGTCRPPYGAEVEAELRAGRHPNVYIMAGANAWGRAQNRLRIHGNKTAIALPDDADPASFKWPALDAVIVDAAGLDHRAMLAITQALIRDGCRFVLVIPESGEALSAWASWARAAA